MTSYLADLSCGSAKAVCESDVNSLHICDSDCSILNDDSANKVS